MRVVIIEDEQYTAAYLQELLLKAAPDTEVTRLLFSVAAAVEYFKTNLPPDLIFCDIQLTDGPSFEIFRQVKLEVPVVFITAYEQYALQAFKANGIDYILKPFKNNDIAGALNKYNQLHSAVVKKVLSYGNHLGLPPVAARTGQKNSSSVLVKYRDSIKPIKISDVAFFRTENKIVQLTTMNHQKYLLNKTLEDVEMLCGDGFYRVNRQVLLNRDAIEEVLQGYARKLVIKLKIKEAPELLVNKTKISDFLSWLSA